ncbi:MAG TPA: pilus assembly protein TadG-related protein [Candidatus Sulfotelmatobacter sp.]|nr:pilus assembly protein TadG-related protein [Candidatus Sulfotelmatobacter sp.]
MMRSTVFRRLLRHRQGNVALMFAFAAVPLVFSVGMGVDYTSASMREDEMNAIADSAALAALRPAVLAQQTAQDSNAPLIAAATNTFNAQAANVVGVTYDPAAVKVTVTSTLSGAATIQTVTVSYTASSQNAFAGVLGKPTLTIGGSSQATSNGAPNINFYLMLDDSGSMAIPSTEDGITTQIANTPGQDTGGAGCAFACHESPTGAATDTPNNPKYPSGPLKGKVEDDFQVARNAGLTLRIDLVAQATQNLMTTAQQTAAAANSEYQVAIYTFDSGFNTIQALTSNLAQAQTSAGNISVEQVYSQNYLTSSNYNDDEDTNYTSAFTQINSVMPNPGNGTNALGDTPQEVLFIVTDGVEDEAVSGTRTYSFTAGSTCTAIKNRGIRIAILYTTYRAIPIDYWYNTYIKGTVQNNIVPSLQACASPNLFFEVDVGGDISGAMQKLFQTAVTTAYLSK